MELRFLVSKELLIEDLGRMGYHEAYRIQEDRHKAVMSARSEGAQTIGVVLFVEHDPVVTVTRRPEAASHVVASQEMLEAAGVEVAQTDRGGDVTYHGPGQLVVYPIVDLNRLNLRIVEYLRVLEEIVIETLGTFGVQGERDPSATGVWTKQGDQLAKVCAMGVRVRRWVTMHGLALNVDPDLSHFRLIVPCGLHGRPVTSLRALQGEDGPDMGEVKEAMTSIMVRRFGELANRAQERRVAQSNESPPGGSQR